MKITKNDVVAELTRAKQNGIKVRDFTQAEIRQLVNEANRDAYWISEEGLWAWIMLRAEVKEDK